MVFTTIKGLLGAGVLIGASVQLFGLVQPGQSVTTEHVTLSITTILTSGIALLTFIYSIAKDRVSIERRLTGLEQTTKSATRSAEENANINRRLTEMFSQIITWQQRFDDRNKQSGK